MSQVKSVRETFCRSCFAFLLCLLAGVSVASAQVDLARLQAIQARTQRQLKNYNSIPAPLRQRMSGVSDLAHLAGMLRAMPPTLLRPAASNAAPRLATASPAAHESESGGVTRVSDPSMDLQYSAMAAFTQSGTSTAWCGERVVVGFNDTGSALQTLLAGTGGLSFTGIALSTNRGATFTDLGPVPAGSNFSNRQYGDPVVVCTSPSSFYYAQLFASEDDAGYSISSISLNTSTDGGETWSDPLPTVNKDGSQHQVDKPWLAADPNNPKRLYISYADFDYSYTDPACPNTARTAIEVIASNDSGVTWGPPAVIDAVCGFADSVQGSHVVVGPAGRIDVAWLHFTNFPYGGREIRFTSYAPEQLPKGYTVIDTVVAGGDGIFLQGGFNDFLGLDMAVDRSHTNRNGTLYVTWDDGRNKTILDFAGSTGLYSFDDVLLRISTDGGATWGPPPIQINSDHQPANGYGHDHYQPGIAVDSAGKLAACWYDRRNDDSNFVIERYCGTSANGLTWTNHRIPVPGFAPVHTTDNLLRSAYMGDYDVVATDFLQTSPGFVSAFQVMNDKANPDVKALSFK